MNRVVTKIAEIDEGEITAYAGNYDFYERERAHPRGAPGGGLPRQQAMLAKEQRFIERFRARRQGRAGAEPHQGARQDRALEPPKKRKVVTFDFRKPPRSGDEVAMLAGVNKGYGDARGPRRLRPRRSAAASAGA